MALSKQKKDAILAQYKEWLAQSQAVVLVEYKGTTMKDLDALRVRVRDAGGEFHIVKNTLAKIALESSGMDIPAGQLEQSTAMGFAYKDVAALVKAINDSGKTIPAIKVKGGFLGSQAMSVSQVKVLADLPPLPVMRAQLLGVLLAPAGKLVRTLAEPARRTAAVIQSYSEKAAPAAV